MPATTRARASAAGRDRWRQIAHQHQDGGELHQVRGLAAEPADADPAPRAAGLVAEEQHEHQRHEPDHVERHRQAQQRRRG